MAGYAPKLPLNPHSKEGYAALLSLETVIEQNLKTLLLTAPGEKLMDMNFGLGLMQYLFEFDTPETRANIKANIHEQVAKYIPAVSILDIQIVDPDSPPEAQGIGAAENLSVLVEYEIAALAYKGTLHLGTPTATTMHTHQWGLNKPLFWDQSSGLDASETDPYAKFF